MKNVSLGDIIQINPNDSMFSTCLATVNEIKDWGVLAYIQIPDKGQAFLRLEWNEFELTGG